MSRHRCHKPLKSQKVPVNGTRRRLPGNIFQRTMHDIGNRYNIYARDANSCHVSSRKLQFSPDMYTFWKQWLLFIFSFLLFFLFLSDRNSSNCSLDSSFQSIILNRFSNHPTHDGPLYHLHRIQLRRQVGQTAVATRTLAKCDSLVRAHRAPRQKRGKSARGRDEWDETLRYECEWRY